MSEEAIHSQLSVDQSLVKGDTQSKCHQALHAWNVSSQNSWKQTCPDMHLLKQCYEEEGGYYSEFINIFSENVDSSYDSTQQIHERLNTMESFFKAIPTRDIQSKSSLVDACITFEDRLTSLRHQRHQLEMQIRTQRELARSSDDARRRLNRIVTELSASVESRKKEIKKAVTKSQFYEKKTKDYQKQTASTKRDLERRGIDPGYTQQSLIDQAEKIRQLKERSQILEESLKRYKGLPSNKEGAKKQLEEAEEKLSGVDELLVNKMRLYRA